MTLGMGAAGAVGTFEQAMHRPPRRRTSVPLRVAVVGCGAMTRENLMPVLAGHEQVHLAGLVDINERTARALADAYGLPTVWTSIDALTPETVDAVILATPPALHAPQAVTLAARGLHVFVEKPMALRAAEAEAMVRAADEAGVALAVGLYRRLLPSTRLLRGLLESGLAGAPLAIDVEEGGAYGWPLASLANLTPALGGGGVLIDIGSHLLDVVRFVVPGRVDRVSYADNARGGVETDALLTFQIESARGAIPCRVELSRTRSLRNSVRVECERAVLELPRGEFADVRLHWRDAVVHDPLSQARPVRVSARWGDEDPPIGYQTFRAEIDDWLAAIAEGGDPQLSGRSGVDTVRLIEDAYAVRRPMAEPWTDEGLSQPPRLEPRARRRRVLITGASGFIGCRTAEILSLREGVDVRAVVRSPGNAARLARLGVELVPGDICSPEDMQRVVRECDAVIHCAVGNSWQRAETVRTTVVGTRTVAEAARLAGVERFVHVSSMAVHGKTAGSTIDESTPLVDPREDSYAGDKRRAEDEVRRQIGQGLPAIILRPARVYGPFGTTFITRPVQHLVRGALTLAGPYDAPASMVYVDNVVDAMIAALGSGEAGLGEAFEISDPEQLSWREFYQAFADALGATLHLTTERPLVASVEAHGLLARWRRGLGEIVTSAELRGLARRCIETDPVGWLPKKLWEAPAARRRIQRVLGMTHATVYRPAPAGAEPRLVFGTEAPLVVAEKAVRVLGWQPAVPRARAMALTLEWVRHVSGA